MHKKIFGVFATVAISLSGFAPIASLLVPITAQANSEHYDDDNNHQQSDSCGIETIYEKSGDFSDSRVNINFESNDNQIDVLAQTGYSVIKVEVDFEGGSTIWVNVGSGNLNNFNPSQGGEINKVKVTIKKICPDLCANIAGDQYTVPSNSDLVGNQCVVKLNICHSTNSQHNPWQAISISQSAWSTHQSEGDFIYGGPTEDGKPKNLQCDDWCGQHVPAKLTVIKTVIGTSTPASAFTLTVSTTTSQLFPGNSTGTTITVTPGAYSVTEPATANFTATLSANCSGTMSYGQIKTCTVTNTYVPPAVAPTPTLATVIATKVVCDSESDLPNWGARTAVLPISATTATDYVNGSNEKCHLEPGWSFQWAPASASNPGDNIATATAPWTPFVFGVTNSSGVTSTLIDVSIIGGSNIWMREVLKSGYIPFTGGSTLNNVSAELYCHTDSLNYDNYDRIDNPVAGSTYYCVAFNARTPLVCPQGQHVENNVCVVNLPPQVCSLVSDTSTKVVEIKIDETASTTVNTFASLVTPTSITTTYWTADVDGASTDAKWIWSEEPITDWTVNKISTFERTFTVSDAVTSATLTLAADNSYNVYLDGNFIGGNLSGNFNSATGDSIAIPSLSVGQHSLKFVVKNLAQDGDVVNNPGGLLFKLALNNATCTIKDNPTPQNIAPVVTLLGDSTVNVNKDVVYSDASATYSDAEDTVNVPMTLPYPTACTITNPVNTSIPNTYTITYSCTDSNGASASVSRTVIVNGAPVITVTGANPMTVTLGESYNELGAIAVDAEDTPDPIAVASGFVDTGAIGQYTITYTATDLGGLSASTTRTVNVYAQCADGKDNDGDTKFDAADPGCHSDNNANNPESYVSTDNNESDLVVINVCPNLPNGPFATIPNGYHADDEGCVLNNEPPVIPPTIVVNPPTGGNPGGSGGHRHGGNGGGRVLGASTECGIYIGEYIKLGAKNNPEEVKKLQSFLNEWTGAGLKVTGIYDQATFNAVKKFQLEYKTDILDPWVKVGLHKDDKTATGYVYKTTQRMINNLVCPALGLEIPDLSSETR